MSVSPAWPAPVKRRGGLEKEKGDGQASYAQRRAGMSKMSGEIASSGCFFTGSRATSDAPH